MPRGYAVSGLTEAAAGSFGGVTIVAPVAGGRHLRPQRCNGRCCAGAFPERAGGWPPGSSARPSSVPPAITAGVVAGLGAGAIGDADAGRDFGEDVAGVSAAVLFGAALSLVQRHLLRREFARLGCWVLAGSVGWIVAGLIAGGHRGRRRLGPILGAVYGAITGFVLAGLLRQPATEAPAPEQ